MKGEMQAAMAEGEAAHGDRGVGWKDVGNLGISAYLINTMRFDSPSV